MGYKAALLTGMIGVPMTKIESHRDLVVWQKAMDLTVFVYRLSAKFPSNEMYRLSHK